MNIHFCFSPQDSAGYSVKETMQKFNQITIYFTEIKFTGGIFWTKFEPTLNKTPTPNSDLCGCLRQPHTHPPPKTGGRAKIPSPKTPSFLPARPLRGRAVAKFENINQILIC